jgi:uncharacterized protein YndB with AHSA1/START domain
MTTFTTSREIQATPDAVFAAFEDPSRLARWWGPDGFTNTFETFEFKVGGKWIFTMHGPDGASYPNEASFSAITKSSKLVIDHVCPPIFQLTITLTAHGAGTLVHWAQVFEDAAVASAVAHIVVPANEQNLDRWTQEVLVGATPAD